MQHSTCCNPCTHTHIGSEHEQPLASALIQVLDHIQVPLITGCIETRAAILHTHTCHTHTHTHAHTDATHPVSTLLHPHCSCHHAQHLCFSTTVSNTQASTGWVICPSNKKITRVAANPQSYMYPAPPCMPVTWEAHLYTVQPMLHACMLVVVHSIHTADVLIAFLLQGIPHTHSST
jgi:hypothetical protein